MASTYTSLPVVSLGSVSLGTVTIDAGTAHIGSVTLDTEGGATGSAVPARAVYIAGKDPITGFLTGVNINAANGGIVGGDAQVVGSAISTFGAGVGGSDGTNFRHLSMNTSGHLKVIGTATTGSAIPTEIVPVAGSDGTNARTLLTDNTGKQIVIGAAVAGSAIPTGLVAVAGSDGTNARAVLTDTTGKPIVVGAATAGSAIPAGLVPIAGSDGTNARAILVSSTGQVAIGGSGAVASAVPTAAVAMGGSDGTNLRILKTDTSGQAILGESTAYIGVTSGKHLLVSTSFTRPADTTLYTTKDVISNSTSAPTILTFSGAGLQNGGSGYIVKARLSTDLSTFTGVLRLWLFHTTITMINDNAPFTLLYTNKDKRVGCIDFTVAGTEGSGSDSVEAAYYGPPIAYKCASGDTALYGILEDITAFTPASGQGFFIELELDQNRGA